MKNLNQTLTAIWLFSALILCLQSCDDQAVQTTKSQVRFALSSNTSSDGRAIDMTLPENARLRLTIESTSGTPIVSDLEVKIMKAGNTYVTDPLELIPGSYSIIDFMIVKDNEVLNAVPKSKSALSALVQHSLPYNFSTSEISSLDVSMQVMDTRNEKPEAFGYNSFKLNATNKLSMIVSNANGGQSSLRGAIAEVRKGKELIMTSSVRPGINTIAFEGDPDAVYSLFVYAGEEATTRTFNFKELKNELGAKPWKIKLEQALLLTVESYVDEANEYEEYFEFALEGTGDVKINWGDGSEERQSLPFYGSHEYTSGRYTAIITGDLDQITNLHGFSYSTIIYAIEGLTNLTALRTYNPSWGAVPINVDLSNCTNLETIFVEKYGAPYEPIDLRTDFKLPEEHFIKDFIFLAPAFDITREYISPEEIEVFVDNIYNNAIQRQIREGRFFIDPVLNLLPETEQKLEVLKEEYNWTVGLNEYPEFDFEGGRIRKDLDARRENWLRNHFPKSQPQPGRSAKTQVMNY